MIYRIFISILCVAAFAGCTTTTGIKKQIDVSKLTSVRSLTINVESQEFVSTFHSDVEQGTKGTAVVFGGLLGYAIVNGMVNSRDTDLLKSINQTGVDTDINLRLVESLTNELSRGERFDILSTDDTSDAHLNIKVLYWGLRRCPDDSYEARSELQLDCQLITSDKSVLWHSVQSFSGGECISVSQSKLDSATLNQNLINTITTAANRIAKELKYAR